MINAGIYGNGRNNFKCIIFHFTIVGIQTYRRYAAVVVNVETGVSDTANCISRYTDGKSFTACGQCTYNAIAYLKSGNHFLGRVKSAVAVEVYPAIDIGICIVSAPANCDVFARARRQIRTADKGDTVFIVGAVVVVAIGIGRRLGAAIHIGLYDTKPGRRTGIHHDAEISIRRGGIAVVVLQIRADLTRVVFHLTADEHHSRFIGLIWRKPEARIGLSGCGVQGDEIREDKGLLTGGGVHRGIVYDFFTCVKYTIAVEIHPGIDVGHGAGFVGNDYF